MTSHKTAVSIHRGKGPSERKAMPVVWNDQWRTIGEASELMRSVDTLWQQANRHHDKAMERAIGKTVDWESKLGLRNEMASVGTMIKTASRARGLANVIEADAALEREGLRPYRSDTAPNAEYGMNRIGLRIAFASLSTDAKHAFLKTHHDEMSRKALFELGSPEMIGLAPDDAVYASAYARGMQEANGDKLAKLDALDNLAKYARTLSDGVKEAATAEAWDAGVTPDQLPAALQAIAAHHVNHP